MNILQKETKALCGIILKHLVSGMTLKIYPNFKLYILNLNLWSDTFFSKTNGSWNCW